MAVQEKKKKKKKQRKDGLPPFERVDSKGVVIHPSIITKMQCNAAQHTSSRGYTSTRLSLCISTFSRLRCLPVRRRLPLKMKSIIENWVAGRRNNAKQVEAKQSDIDRPARAVFLI